MIKCEAERDLDCQTASCYGVVDEECMCWKAMQTSFQVHSPIMGLLAQSACSFSTAMSALAQSLEWCSSTCSWLYDAVFLPTTCLLSISSSLHVHWCFFSQSILVGFCKWTNWQHANHTVSKERGGDYCAMASCQGVLNEGWKRVKEGGFDWWMVWKWVSWGGSSTLVNISPCTRPSCMRNSLVCIKSCNCCLHHGLCLCWVGVLCDVMW